MANDDKLQSYSLSEKHKNYDQHHAIEFVRYLGLWSYPVPANCLDLRSPQDYRDMLLQVVEVNRTRKDNVGRWETRAAIEELNALIGR